MTEPEFLAHLAPVRRLLWFHARRLSRRRGVEAEDLYQSAVLELWASRAKAVGHPEPSKWFAQAAVWAMLRHLERQGRHPAVGLDADAHAAAFSTTDNPPDEFAALVGLLPADVRGLAVGRFADGLTLEQLAADVGITPAGVRNRLETAFEQVRGRLAG